MPSVIDRDEVRRLMVQDAQLVEVLPRHEYEHEHLVGAVSIPLKELSGATAASLNRWRPVVTYCHDYL